MPSALPRAARTRRLQRLLGLSWRGAPQRGACLRGYGRSSPRPGRSPASGGSASHPQYESVVLGEPTLLVAGARRVPTWWRRRAEPTVTALISPDPKRATAQRGSIAVRCGTVLPPISPSGSPALQSVVETLLAYRTLGADGESHGLLGLIPVNGTTEKGTKEYPTSPAVASTAARKATQRGGWGHPEPRNRPTSIGALRPKARPPDAISVIREGPVDQGRRPLSENGR